jgi:hypothetical protein
MIRADLRRIRRDPSDAIDHSVIKPQMIDTHERDLLGPLSIISARASVDRAPVAVVRVPARIRRRCQLAVECRLGDARPSGSARQGSAARLRRVAGTPANRSHRASELSPGTEFLNHRPPPPITIV